MHTQLTAIERTAKNNPQKIWSVPKAMTVVQNMKDDSETNLKLIKKLITDRMAEAEAKGEALDYDKIEAIIEADVDSDGKTPAKSTDNSNDLAVALQAMFGKGGRSRQGQGQ